MWRFLAVIPAISQEEIKKEIQILLVEKFNFEIEYFFEDSYLEDNKIYLNSLQLLQLSVLISKKYNVKFANDFLKEKNFNNLEILSEKISNLIKN